MRMALLLFVLLLPGTPAPALEPVNERHEVKSFDMEGGYFRKWTRENFAPPSPESPPTELRFVITGINPDDRWSSTITFFFKEDAWPDTDNTESSEKNGGDLRLRFVWNKRREVLIPELRVMLRGKEEEMVRVPMPIALNEPATLAIERRDADTLKLLLNGEDIFVNFSDRMNRLTVVVSGVLGAVSLPRAKGAEE